MGAQGVARGGVRKITKKDCKACKLKKKKKNELQGKTAL